MPQFMNASVSLTIRFANKCSAKYFASIHKLHKQDRGHLPHMIVNLAIFSRIMEWINFVNRDITVYNHLRSVQKIGSNISLRWNLFELELLLIMYTFFLFCFNFKGSKTGQ